MSQQQLPFLGSAAGASAEMGADTARQGSRYGFDTRRQLPANFRQANLTPDGHYSRGSYGYVNTRESGFSAPGSAMTPPGRVVMADSGQNHMLSATIPSPGTAEIDSRTLYERDGAQVVAGGGNGEAGYGSTWIGVGGDNPNQSAYPEMTGARAAVGSQVIYGAEAGAHNQSNRERSSAGTTPGHETARRDYRLVLDIAQLYAALKPSSSRPSISSRPPSNDANCLVLLQGPVTVPAVRDVTLMLGSSGQFIYVRASRSVVTGQDVIDALAAKFSDYLHGCDGCAGVCRCERMEAILRTLKVLDG